MGVPVLQVRWVFDDIDDNLSLVVRKQVFEGFDQVPY